MNEHVATHNPIDPASRGPALQKTQRLLLWAAAAVVGGLITSVTLSLSHPHEETLPAAPISVSAEHVEIAAGAPAWGYIELTSATLGPSVPPAPVPGRVAVDEARASSVVASLPGRVDAVAVRLGERVNEGDRLVSVRSAPLVDLFHEVEIEHSEETARTKLVERLRELVKLKAAPEKDLIAMEQDLRETQLKREAAELKLRSLSVATASEGLYWLTARRSGVIVERTVLTGQEVGPERSEPLLVVASLDEVIVTADVPESDVVGLQVGQSATVAAAALPDRELTGTVEHVGEVVDPVRHMVNVRIRVPNEDHALRPNAFVQVAFTTDNQPRLLAAAEAVVTDDQRSFVFVQPHDHPTTLERRTVVTGRQRDGKVEILKGLEPGDTYVAKGAILLLNAIDLSQ